MSETPRTDGINLLDADKYKSFPGRLAAMIEFARQLEREIAALQEELAQARAVLACGHPKALDDSYGGCVLCIYAEANREGDQEIERLEARVEELEEELRQSRTGIAQVIRARKMTNYRGK